MIRVHAPCCAADVSGLDCNVLTSPTCRYVPPTGKSSGLVTACTCAATPLPTRFHTQGCCAGATLAGGARTPQGGEGSQATCVCERSQVGTRTACCVSSSPACLALLPPAAWFSVASCTCLSAHMPMMRALQVRASHGQELRPGVHARSCLDLCCRCGGGAFWPWLTLGSCACVPAGPVCRGDCQAQGGEGREGSRA